MKFEEHNGIQYPKPKTYNKNLIHPTEKKTTKTNKKKKKNKKKTDPTQKKQNKTKIQRTNKSGICQK